MRYHIALSVQCASTIVVRSGISWATWSSSRTPATTRRFAGQSRFREGSSARQRSRRWVRSHAGQRFQCSKLRHGLTCSRECAVRSSWGSVNLRRWSTGFASAPVTRASTSCCVSSSMPSGMATTSRLIHPRPRAIAARTSARWSTGQPRP